MGGLVAAPPLPQGESSQQRGAVLTSQRERKEGGKEGGKEGKKEGRKEGRKEGGKEGRKEAGTHLIKGFVCSNATSKSPRNVSVAGQRFLHVLVRRLRRLGLVLHLPSW